MAANTTAKLDARGVPPSRALSRWRIGTSAIVVVSSLGGCIPDELIHDPGAGPAGGTGAAAATGSGASGSGGNSGSGAGSSGGAGWSCKSNEPGADASCGAGNDDDCCATLHVPGGAFLRRYDGIDYTSEEYPATVSAFDLDVYEITLGRLRGFAADWIDGYRPTAGSGKHTHLPGGGLDGEEGWQNAWAGEVPYDAAAWEQELTVACLGEHTFDQPGDDTRPAQCISWYVAHAFCIWDGGFLPTDAEWNFAASGGDEQRPYPWSGADIDETRAVYDCAADGSTAFSVNGDEFVCAETDILPVGSKPAGLGRWGHADLAGGVAEWVLDGIDHPQSCNDCVSPSRNEYREYRGGSWRDVAAKVLVSSGNSLRQAFDAVDTHGARCARSPEAPR
jgi:formylglycine-generating enzyme required for sulfatase activity